jgi:hypothetical protein
MKREGERGCGPSWARVGGGVLVVLLSLGFLGSCSTPQAGPEPERTPETVTPETVVGEVAVDADAVKTDAEVPAVSAVSAVVAPLSDEGPLGDEGPVGEVADVVSAEVVSNDSAKEAQDSLTPAAETGSETAVTDGDQLDAEIVAEFASEEESSSEETVDSEASAVNSALEQAEELATKVEETAEDAVAAGETLVDAAASELEAGSEQAGKVAEDATREAEEVAGEVLTSVVTATDQATDGAEEKSAEFLQRIADLVAANGRENGELSEAAAKAGESASGVVPTPADQEDTDIGSAAAATGTAATEAVGTVLTSAGETARSGDSSEPKKALSAALQSEAVALPSAGEAASSAAQVVPSDAEAEDEAEGLDRWLVLLLWGVAALACVAFLFRRKRVSGS